MKQTDYEKIYRAETQQKQNRKNMPSKVSGNAKRSLSLLPPLMNVIPIKALSSCLMDHPEPVFFMALPEKLLLKHFLHHVPSNSNYANSNGTVNVPCMFAVRTWFGQKSNFCYRNAWPIRTSNLQISILCLAPNCHFAHLANECAHFSGCLLYKW